MTDLYPILAILLLWLAAYTDLTRRLIRNWVSLALLLLFILYAFFTAKPVDLLGHFLWAIGLFIPLLIAFTFDKVGGGDVKLATVVMLWVGPSAGLEFLFVTALSGGVLALAIVIPTIRHAREWTLAPFAKYLPMPDGISAQSVPYGVAIAVGGTVALFGRYMAGD